MIVLTIVSVPCGVFVFLNYLLSECINDALNGFRPLRGLRISQSISNVLNVIMEPEVSVPCGVFVFLNSPSVPHLPDSPFLVSVPCGVFVFLNKYINDHKDSVERHMVSVPCGVFVFLNNKEFRNG